MSTPESTVPREAVAFDSNARGADRRWGMAVAILALAGAGLVLLSTAKYGAGLSPDSTAYLDVARNLMSGKGFVFRTGEPLVLWPPLYPMLLALIGSATRLDPAVFAHFVNAALFALVICLSARLFRTGPRQTTTYRVLGVCAVLLSRPLSQVYAMAWSECLFIPLVLLCLAFAQRYWDSGGMLSLVVMTLSTALACLTRYIGLALVPTSVVTIILASGASFKTRFTRAFAFAALSLAPLGLWLVHNHRLSGTLMGDRAPSSSPIADNVIVFAQTSLLWYVPGRGTKFIVLAGAAIALVAFVSSQAARSRALSSLKAILRGHPPSVLFLMTCTIMLLATSSATAYDPIGDRLLSPVYVAATLVLLKLVSGLFSPTRLPATALARRAPAILLALWLCLPLTSTARDTAGRLRSGAGGYNTKRWRESETVAYAEQLSIYDGVYSNDVYALGALTGVNATLAPEKTQYDSTGWANELGDLAGRWPPDGEAYLVWFRNGKIPGLFSVAELAGIVDIVETAHLSDGSVYRVSARQTAAHDSSQWGAAHATSAGESVR